MFTTHAKYLGQEYAGGRHERLPQAIIDARQMAQSAIEAGRLPGHAVTVTEADGRIRWRWASFDEVK